MDLFSAVLLPQQWSFVYLPSSGRKFARFAVRTLALGLVFSMTWVAKTHAGTTINVAAGNVNQLIGAIRDANTELGAFAGPDTINLAAGSTYTLTTGIVEPESSGPNGLPVVSSQIVINGNGATIQRALGDGTPENPCGGTAAKFRLLRVTQTRQGVEARLTLRNVTLRYGCAILTDPASSADGGALVNGGGPLHAGTTVLENVIIENNAATRDGGAIRNATGEIRATNCIIRNNRAGNGGGGIANVSQSPGVFPSGLISLNRCTIALNTAVNNGGGGILNESDGTLLITNSTITRNAAAVGGGIRNSASEFTILDTTFDRNTASDTGGAIHNNSTILSTLTNVTLVQNSAPNGGGGILNRRTSPLSLLNTLLSNIGNCGGTAITSEGHNLASDNTCALNQPGDRPGTNPQLGPYTDDGKAGNGHYPLLAGSPAIDAGDQGECAADPELARDQIGTPRSDGACDIGAIEAGGGAGQGAPFAVFRLNQGRWFFDMDHDGGTDLAVTYGMNGDIAVPGDYDGNETTDLAVFRPSAGTWFVDTDRNGTTNLSRRYGMNGDIPVPGDYNGDGVTDFAVFRPSAGTWFVDTDRNGTTNLSRRYGMNGDIPVVGDYDGDGEADLAVFRPSAGTWFVDWDKNGGTDLSRRYGVSSDIPVPNDYDGDFMTDLAVFRPSTGTWFVDTDHNGTTNLSRRYGANGDMPLWPNGWVFQALEIFP